MKDRGLDLLLLHVLLLKNQDQSIVDCLALLPIAIIFQISPFYCFGSLSQL
jgi:hypothetical protein